MDLRKKIDLLERAISIEERAIRAQQILSVVVACIGVFAAVLVHLLAGPTVSENSKWILSLCGTFISGGAGFPLKDIFGKRNKIAALTYLREEYEVLQDSSASTDRLQIEELEKRFWTFFDKNF